MNDPEQEIQKADYVFPYHHLPKLERGRFSQVKTLNWGYEYLSYLHFVAEIVVGLEVETVLDVGCGDGRFLAELDRKLPAKRLVGLDYSDRAIEFAQLLGSPNAEYHSGDVTDPEAVSGRFDVITLIETLEHIPPAQCAPFLLGVRSFLRPGGSLLVTVPSTNVPRNPKHYRHFDLDSLRETLAPTFQVVEHHYINRTSRFVKQVFEKLLINRFYALTSPRIGGWAYSFYLSHFFACSSSDSKRIVVRCVAEQTGSPKGPFQTLGRA